MGQLGPRRDKGHFSIHCAIAHPCMDKWQPGFCGGLVIALGVSHVQGLIQMVPFHDQPDIVAFALLCLAKALKVTKILA